MKGTFGDVVFKDGQRPMEIPGSELLTYQQQDTFDAFLEELFTAPNYQAGKIRLNVEDKAIGVWHRTKFSDVINNVRATVLRRLGYILANLWCHELARASIEYFRSDISARLLTLNPFSAGIPRVLPRWIESSDFTNGELNPEVPTRDFKLDLMYNAAHSDFRLWTFAVSDHPVGMPSLPLGMADKSEILVDLYELAADIASLTSPQYGPQDLAKLYVRWLQDKPPTTALTPAETALHGGKKWRNKMDQLLAAPKLRHVPMFLVFAHEFHHAHVSSVWARKAVVERICAAATATAVQQLAAAAAAAAISNIPKKMAPWS